MEMQKPSGGTATGSASPYCLCIKRSKGGEKIELGQKYLTEMNYTEAVASFTEAIKLEPDNIQAYIGRAEAYMALGEYDKALEDYQFVSSKTEKLPYTRALSYIGQAEVYEKQISRKRLFRTTNWQKPF